MKGRNKDIISDINKIQNCLQKIEEHLNSKTEVDTDEESVPHNTLGYMISLNLGHNGSLDQKEQSELKYHLKASQFI